MSPMRILGTLLVLAASLWSQADYDLLLKSGHVIDPRNGIDARRDVAIRAGRIAEVSPEISPTRAHKVVDVSGLYVTPGLVDIHVHLAGGRGPAYTGDLSVFPDGHTLRGGVTTVVDAGTSGWRNFATFKENVIDRARTRVLAMLNIAGGGMAGPPEQDTTDMDTEATASQARRYKEFIVGIKTAHYEAPDWVAVERAVEAGRLAGVPVMVDFGSFQPKRPFEELVLKKLRPGDIYTHMYLARVPMLDEQGRVRPFLFEARKRGVIFDAGHGAGSFVFRQAVPAIQQGLPPDSISTDLHVNSMNAGMKDMLNVMSKFLNLGLTIQDVVARSTWNPAREIRREELGHLSPGAVADVTVLRVLSGEFGFVDVFGARMKGNRKLVAELTVKDGLVVWDLNGITRQDWDKLGNYDSQSDPVWDGTLGRRR